MNQLNPFPRENSAAHDISTNQPFHAVQDHQASNQHMNVSPFCRFRLLAFLTILISSSSLRL